MDHALLDAVIRQTAAEESDDANVIGLLQTWQQDHAKLSRVVPLIVTRYRRAVREIPISFRRNLRTLRTDRTNRLLPPR